MLCQGGGGPRPSAVREKSREEEEEEGVFNLQPLHTRRVGVKIRVPSRENGKGQEMRFRPTPKRNPKLGKERHPAPKMRAEKGTFRGPPRGAVQRNGEINVDRGTKRERSLKSSNYWVARVSAPGKERSTQGLRPWQSPLCRKGKQGMGWVGPLGGGPEQKLET